MPRQVRIEYAGATYHVMCRGDRQEAIFWDDGDREMLCATLAETVERTGWRVHAWVWMDNHYHLVVETPEPNLVRGMSWFQATYTARFNARHRQRGHLFGGRYKAVLVSPEAGAGAYFTTMLDYVHLNPVRAGLLKAGADGLVADLSAYRWSSWPGYLQPQRRPEWLSTSRAFAVWGEEDSARGRKAVLRRVQARTTQESAEACGLSEIDGQGLQSTLRRGWYYGPEAFRNELLKKAAPLLAKRGQVRINYHGPELRQHGEQAAERLLKEGLRLAKLRPSQLPTLKKGDPRKAQIAATLHAQTTVPLAWIAQALHMGTPSNVSQACKRCAKS